MLLKSVKFSSYKDLVRRSLIEGKTFYFYRDKVLIKVIMNLPDEVYLGSPVLSAYISGSNKEVEMPKEFNNTEFFEELLWYENIPPKGLICKMSDVGEVTRVIVVVKYDRNRSTLVSSSGTNYPINKLEPLSETDTSILSNWLKVQENKQTNSEIAKMLVSSVIKSGNAPMFWDIH